MAVNGIGWFEIGTDNPAAAERFYGDVFGWAFSDDDSVTAAGTPYRLATPPGAPGPGGGLFDTAGKTPGYAIFYVHVEDTREACRRAEAAGGKVLVAPKVDDGGLSFAHLLDPTGNHFGVFTQPANRG